MGVESCFQIVESNRIEFIEKNIVGNLPENSRDTTRQRATKITNDFEGVDIDALSILAYAAKRGKFDEYAGKLEEHFEENLQYIHPKARRLAKVPGAIRTNNFFVGCYKEMGIES